MTGTAGDAPFRRGTALRRYVRLEALGSWRESPEAAAREVVVSFGNATLVLADGTDRPLGHWALAGVRVLERTPAGTTYAMTPQGYETLTIRDPEMIEAIAAVSAAARGFPPPAPRRARRWRGILATLVAVAALAAAVGAGARLVPRQAAAMVPAPRAERYGDEMLIRLVETRGPPCAAPAAAWPLARLVERTVPPATARVTVLDLDAPVAVLPGGHVVLDRALPAAAGSPEELAGWIALALAAEAGTPATLALMERAGPLASLRFVLNGTLDEARLAAAADAVDAEPPPLPPETLERLAGRLAAAGIPAAPLAGALRRGGDGAAADTLLALSLPRGPADPPLLTPEEWQALRAICD